MNYESLICVVIAINLIVNCINGFQLTLTDTRRHKRLIGETLYTLSATDSAKLISRCLQSCLVSKDSKCKAINVNKAKLVCELLSTSAIEQGSKIEDFQGWEYYGPKEREPVRNRKVFIIIMNYHSEIVEYFVD